MDSKRREEFGKLLQGMAESLDISDTQYDAAVKHYEAVAEWLNTEDSPIAKHEPGIYPQGSFRLGTMIKPVNDADEYDIDLVCELKKLQKKDVSQKQLKQMVGDRLRSNGDYSKKLKEGSRCWKLQYADSARFHMDILPALPDMESFSLLLEEKGVSADWTDSAIAITDNTLPNYDRIDDDWPCSNPKGYAEWFKERMIFQFEARRKMLAEAEQKDVETVHDYRVKTPLQRAIQILKRHRDIMFADDKDDKPASIIITTLAAHAYGNEDDLLDALNNIVDNMPRHIENRAGVSWVPNPVNPLENFADRWDIKKHPQREAKFMRWLGQVRSDINTALCSKDIQSVAGSVKPHFGEGVVNKALRDFQRTNTGKAPGLIISGTRSLSRFNVPHREPPPWSLQPHYSITLSGHFKNNGQWHSFDSDSRLLPKHCDLVFTAKTNAPSPFHVYWQVVNTGAEAESYGKRELRGGIFPAKTAGIGGLKQRESTLYTGMHWVECFIVKNGVCVARSGEFVVNIE